MPNGKGQGRGGPPEGRGRPEGKGRPEGAGSQGLDKEHTITMTDPETGEVVEETITQRVWKDAGKALRDAGWERVEEPDEEPVEGDEGFEPEEPEDPEDPGFEPLPES